MKHFYTLVLSCMSLSAWAQQTTDTTGRKIFNLKGVDVSANADKGGHLLSKIDLQLQPVKSAQDLLRTVPGLFIAQHAGGGKAEQILVRGIDNDHGTDFGIFVDGIPVNLPNHAHGQGYADMHFLIPEAIGGASYYKGPYEASQGDFTNAGAAVYSTLFKPTNQFAKVEVGSFNTARVAGLMNVVNQEKKNAYVIADYTYTDSYFNSPQYFNRFNFLARYNVAINTKNTLSIIGSGFTSSWHASGQVPQRAIEDGALSRFGAIDPSEGGKTTRINANVMLETNISGRSIMKQQAYYVRNNFDLWSNFTFYKDDPINGDEIKQWERRDMVGYKNTFNHTGKWGNATLLTEAGISARIDFVILGRDHVKERAFLSNEDSSRAIVGNYSAYINETVQFANGLSFSLGLRNDFFTFDLHDYLIKNISGNKTANRLSPKFSVYYDVSPSWTIFAKTGTGFHSNYANVAIQHGQSAAVPRSYGADLGTNFKLGNKALVTATIWWLQCDAEYKFVADEGSFENLGRTTRTGVDLALRYHIANPLWADVNLNFAHPRLMDEVKNENYIPFAPVFTSTGGLTYQSNSGISASLRYRYMGQRPAIEDNSVKSRDYLIFDAVVKYNYKHYEWGLSAENLTNRKWAEAQFYDESQLKGEAAPVMDFHITPGTPFALTASMTVRF